MLWLDGLMVFVFFGFGVFIAYIGNQFIFLDMFSECIYT